VAHDTARQTWSQPPAACAATSVGNAASSDRTSRTVPSGWAQAPRPTTTPVEPFQTDETSDPPDTTQRRTWQGQAGLVTAKCDGARISLVAAQPYNGYRVEVESHGPVELTVHFERSSEGGETQVTGVCQGGSPQFDAQTGDE
jgi:hypothetical protein